MLMTAEVRALVASPLWLNRPEMKLEKWKGLEKSKMNTETKAECL